MSNLKEELYKALYGHGVKYIDTWRVSVMLGDTPVPVQIVSVYATDRPEPHIHAAKPDTPVEEIIEYFKQHLRNRT